MVEYEQHAAKEFQMVSEDAQLIKHLQPVRWPR